MEVEISPDGFMGMIRHLNGGAVLEEIDRALIDGLQAIAELGGSADINIKLKLSRTKGLNGTITIQDDIVTKFPKHARPASLMFETAGFGLVTQQQDQTQLDLTPSATERAPSLTPTDKSNVSHLGAKS